MLPVREAVPYRLFDGHVRIGIMSARQQLVNVLRQAHLLQFVDSLLFRVSVRRTAKDNAAFLREQLDFVPPPLALAFDAYNHTSWRAYFAMGKSHADMIAELVKEYLPATGSINICEWGCGPGRVIQHLRALPEFEKVDLVGADYNDETIAWCKATIRGITFIKNSLQPPLDVKTGTLDCVYAISVFTHLSEEMHFRWIAELFRVLRPGGLLIFTTHGDQCLSQLLRSEKEQYSKGQIVVRGKIKEGRKHFSAHHPAEFIKNTLLRNHEVLKHFNAPERYLVQDEWAVRS